MSQRVTHAPVGGNRPLGPASVNTVQLAPRAVNSGRIAFLAVEEANIADLAVTTAKIDSAAITSAKIDALAVGTAQIADAAITSAKIDAAAVTTAKIGAAAITTALIADAAVTSAKVQSLDVAKLASGTITAATITLDSLLKVVDASNVVRLAIGDVSTVLGDVAGTDYGLLMADASGATMIDMSGVRTLGLVDAAVVTAKLADASVSTVKIINGDVTTALIADAAITSAKIMDATIATGDIADLAVVQAKIGTAAVGTAQIGDLQVTQGKIALAAIGTAQIADAAITSAKIGNAQIETAHIADLAVDNLKIAGNAVRSNHILNGELRGAASTTSLAASMSLTTTFANVLTLTVNPKVSGDGAVIAMGAIEFTTTAVTAGVEMRIVVTNSTGGTGPVMGMTLNFGAGGGQPTICGTTFHVATSPTSSAVVQLQARQTGADSATIDHAVLTQFSISK